MYIYICIIYVYVYVYIDRQIYIYKIDIHTHTIFLDGDKYYCYCCWYYYDFRELGGGPCGCSLNPEGWSIAQRISRLRKDPGYLKGDMKNNGGCNRRHGQSNIRWWEMGISMEFSNSAMANSRAGAGHCELS